MPSFWRPITVQPRGRPIVCSQDPTDLTGIAVNAIVYRRALTADVPHYRTSLG